MYAVNQQMGGLLVFIITFSNFSAMFIVTTRFIGEGGGRGSLDRYL